MLKQSPSRKGCKSDECDKQLNAASAGTEGDESQNILSSVSSQEKRLGASGQSSLPHSHFEGSSKPPSNRVRKDTFSVHFSQEETPLPYTNHMLLGLDHESMHTRSKHYLDANYDDEKYREVLIQYIRKTGKDKLMAIDDIDDFLKPPQRIIMLDNTQNPPAPLVIEDPTMEMLFEIANEVGLKPLPQPQILEASPEPLKTIAGRAAKTFVESPVKSIAPAEPVDESPVKSVAPAEPVAESPVKSVAPSEPVAKKIADQPVKSVAPAEPVDELPVKSVAPAEPVDESPVKSVAPSELVGKTLTEPCVTPVADFQEISNYI